jgi:hypothetical protein
VSPAEGAEQLQFRFQPGDKFYLLTVTEQTTTRVVDGNQQVFEQTVRLGCDLDIEEVQGDGCAWAKYSYRQAALKVKGQGVSVDYDSDANQPKMSSWALPLAVVLGEGFYIRITPQGRIDKINGLQTVVGSAKSKVPNIANKEQIIQTIDNQFAEAGIKRELENWLAVFPDANAVTGDPCLIWSRTEQIDEEEVMVERTFRLKESRPSLGGIAIIDVNIVIRPAAAAQETVSGGVRMRREVSGQGAGQIEIDESTGRIINSVLTQDSVEEIKTSSEGPVRRIPTVSEPVTRHIVKTFRMNKRDSEKPPPSGVEGSQPNQP